MTKEEKKRKHQSDKIVIIRAEPERRLPTNKVSRILDEFCDFYKDDCI